MCDLICILWDEATCTSALPSLTEQAVKKSESQEILEIHGDSVEELLSHAGTHQFTAGPLGSSRTQDGIIWRGDYINRSHMPFIVLVIFMMESVEFLQACVYFTDLPNSEIFYKYLIDSN